MNEPVVVDKYVIKNRQVTKSVTGAVRVTAEVWHLGEKVYDYDRGGVVHPGTTDEELNRQIVNTAIRDLERQQAEAARRQALEATLASLADQDEFEVLIYEEPEVVETAPSADTTPTDTTDTAPTDTPSAGA